MDTRARATALQAELAPVLAGSPVVLDAVEIHPAGRRRLLRLTVARDLSPLAPDDDSSPIEPLTLDEIAEAARSLGAALDDSPSVGSAPYVLEVTSAGVDQPLVGHAALRRNVGRLLEVQRAEGEPVRGRLVAVRAGALVLDGRPEPLPLVEVTQVRVEVEFARPGDTEATGSGGHRGGQRGGPRGGEDA